MPCPTKARNAAFILAADLFCYFGALADVFAAAHANLTPGRLAGLLGRGTAARPRRRRARRQRRPLGAAAAGPLRPQPAYVRDTAAAAGFEVLRLDRETVRYEADAPVAGLLLAVLQRVRHDG